ncbi:MAG: diaminopimelate epimerase [Desulfobacterales bacterium]|jgi:diaminopimelate epimerase|nr:diaminopimelate epimerase [Desulfobacterales bacterium]
MAPIAFTKMSGCGNDFIVIDNRGRPLDEASLAALVTGVCRRRLSVGADGVILIEASAAADFRWRFFNADGSRAEMCGNGARCAARFAVLNGIGGPQVSFETDAGLIRAQVDGTQVRVAMPEPGEIRLERPLALAAGLLRVSTVDTGVPHAVLAVADVAEVDVVGLGREIRRHPAFAPAGTNADFISTDGAGGLCIRTYERGVEDETLACGTGAVAAALVAAETMGAASPVRLRTRSGEPLTVHFRRRGGRFCDIFQEGGARVIFTGSLSEEAWR